MSTILIFLKAPRLGTVKTRLADTVGPKVAQSIYRELVEGQMARLSERDSICVQYAPHDAAADMTAWLGADVSYRAQCEGDLGARLSDAIMTHFQMGHSRLICIGGDCPQLAVRHIAAAESAMDAGADLALGPTEDGGFYLLGLSAPHSGLFSAVRWSTESTRSDVIKNATQLNLKVEQLEMLYDVDDWMSYQRAIAEGHQMALNFVADPSSGVGLTQSD
jgi:rSAM/selenodomain-associated transferase 1